MKYPVNPAAVTPDLAAGFTAQGYQVLRGLLDTSALYDYALSIRARGDLDDSQVPETPSFYGDTVFNEVQSALLAAVEAATGCELYMAYTYFRIYKHGDVLRCHTDREACEISGTLHIGGTDPWPIFVMDRDENPVEVLLNAGDMLLYRGAELHHWRPLYKGAGDYVQVFFHFVDRAGPHANHRRDGQRLLDAGIDRILALKQKQQE